MKDLWDNEAYVDLRRCDIDEINTLIRDCELLKITNLSTARSYLHWLFVNRYSILSAPHISDSDILNLKFNLLQLVLIRNMNLLMSTFLPDVMKNHCREIISISCLLEVMGLINSSGEVDYEE